MWVYCIERNDAVVVVVVVREMPTQSYHSRCFGVDCVGGVCVGLDRYW